MILLPLLGAHAPAPHPQAPQEIVDSFQSFLAKLQSSSGGPSNPSSTPKGQSTSQSKKGETGGEEAENDREMLGEESRSGRDNERGSREGGVSVESRDNGDGGRSMASNSVRDNETRGRVDFENFWEAPAFTWRHPEVTDREIDAVMVSFQFHYIFQLWVYGQHGLNETLQRSCAISTATGFSFDLHDTCSLRS